MTPYLPSYDWIVVCSSAGKDSLAMLDVVAGLAREAEVLDRLVVVHADLGRVEWKGTRELAARQAALYGARFEVVTRPQGDLIDHIRARKRFPGPGLTRYCTSDHKRGPIFTLYTRLAKELGRRGRPARILECMGLRAEESPARAKQISFRRREDASNGRRLVDAWLPIHAWSTPAVWDHIRGKGLPYHPAYDLGMPRLSCCFCIYSPRAALMLAGKHNPELLAEYVALEAEIGHSFQHSGKRRLPIADVKAALDRGEEAGKEAIASWCM
jgi:3'-phosphoadenosine 5'-phosphosulfate sulfotransferase (PAPS reductase)/FAD synthetase